MDFDFNEEQLMLRDMAREVLSRHCTAKDVRRVITSPAGFDQNLWQQIADLQWPGLELPEEYGGAGMHFLDASVIVEEAGRAVLPSPYLSSAVLAAPLLAKGGSAAQKRRWLPDLAAGKAKATVALGDAHRGAGGVTVTAGRRGDQFVLNGSARFVPYAHTADLILVAARAEGGAVLLPVAAGAAGVSVRVLDAMDVTDRLCEVAFQEVGVPVSEALADGDALLAEAVRRATVASCLEMVGAADQILQMAVPYLKERTQFDRPIGSFQAIKHKCADMLLAIESSRSATYYAAWAVSEAAADADLAVSVAKAYCSDSLFRTASDGIQIHGGIGFTWEHDLHFFFKRIKKHQALWGNGDWHAARIADSLIPAAG